MEEQRGGRRRKAVSHKTWWGKRGREENKKGEKKGEKMKGEKERRSEEYEWRKEGRCRMVGELFGGDLKKLVGDLSTSDDFWRFSFWVYICLGTGAHCSTACAAKKAGCGERLVHRYKLDFPSRQQVSPGKVSRVSARCLKRELGLASKETRTRLTGTLWPN